MVATEDGTEGGAEGDEGRCSNDMERFNLVDKVMDEIGLGRFHAIMFIVASLGYFVEAAEMGILSILYPQFVQVWEVEQTDLSIIGSLTGVGMICGTAFFGRLADNIGRKPVYRLSLILCIVLGFISSFANSVAVFAVMRMFLGFAYGGNIVSAATLLLENAPLRYRGFLSALLQFAFAFGQIFVIVVSWGLMESLGWQWIVRIVSLIGTPILFGLLVVPRSVRFCIAKEDYEGAYEAVVLMCRRNRKPVPPYFTLENLAGVNAKEIKVEKNLCIDLTHLFTEPSLRSVILPLMSIWLLNAFGHGLNSFIPLELKTLLDGDNIQYKVAFSQAIGSIVGAFVVTFVSTRMGRIPELRLGLTCLALCIASFTFLSKHLVLLMLVLVAQNVGVALTFHVLYTYTPEVFPTSIRVTAFSMCQMGNRIAPVFSPFLITFLSVISFRLCTLVFSGIFFSALFVTVFLRRDTYNQQMVESHGEVVACEEPDGFGARTTRYNSTDSAISMSSAISIEMVDAFGQHDEMEII